MRRKVVPGELWIRSLPPKKTVAGMRELTWLASFGLYFVTHTLAQPMIMHALAQPVIMLNTYYHPKFFNPSISLFLSISIAFSNF
jgi:hypothetical protein